MNLKNKSFIKGANPYMPLWEHVPDGEPKVFTYNGETRVYVYGSHDTLKTEYCGLDQVVWSAPADDLTDWTCHGVCFRSPDGKPLYAPDVVQKGDTFYMYAAPDCGDRVIVASSKNPAGPFENPKETEIGFDPGVLVDDDGRTYVYWGFVASHCAELEEDMATMKPGTRVKNIIPHCETDGDWWKAEPDHTDNEFRFFEASSLRKIGDKYIYIYSQRRHEAEPEEGLPARSNCYLSYAYSDSPMGGWKYGGVISINGGAILETESGDKTRSYPMGNNHGSIICVNGQWYIFYHRMTGTTEFARQAMLDPIDVAIGRDGHVYIGKITYDEDGQPTASRETEMTSQGAHFDGLDARAIISAGYACRLTSETEDATPFAHSSKGAYVKPVYDRENPSAPIVNIKSGTVAGYKYINFGDTAPKELYIKLDNAADGAVITVRLDGDGGEVISKVVTKAGQSEYIVPVSAAAIGKRELLFEFGHDDRIKEIGEFDLFTFE